MELDDEDAPVLVDVNEVNEIYAGHEAASATTHLRDLSLIKVPLTIVTGESKVQSS